MLNAGQSSQLRENFLKVNKGLRNRSINCYANACMQALMACPAFFEMLRHAKNIMNDEKQPLGPALAEKNLLNKFIKLSDKFFPGTDEEQSEAESTTTLPAIKEEESTKDNSAELQGNTSMQIDSLQVTTDSKRDTKIEDNYDPFKLNADLLDMVSQKFSKKTDLAKIFKEEMEFFNPGKMMQDTSEFLNFMLDKLHEEIVDINKIKVPLQSNKMVIGNNTIKDSAIWQIFGSTLNFHQVAIQ